MYKKIAHVFINLFPLWVILCAAITFFYPRIISGLQLDSYVSVLLGIVMLGMGLTMSPGDFKLVFSRPRLIVFGVALRCLLMPLIAFALVHLLQLPDSLAIGLILVGCCPSGTASNVMTLIAKGDVALSVTLTSVVTVLSPILTPLSFYLLAGSYISVNMLSMFLSIFYVVIVPVGLGVLLHVLFSHYVEKIKPFVPIVSIVTIIIIIMTVVANNTDKLAELAAIAFAAVVLHNGLGLALGYGLSRFLGISIVHSRAITFEIGMENSGLAVVLANAAALNPMAAVPAVIFSLWHNISGSLLASYWAKRSDKA